MGELVPAVGSSEFHEVDCPGAEDVLVSEVVISGAIVEEVVVVTAELIGAIAVVLLEL